VSAPVTVAMLGLGEAGGALGADLAAAGARVRGWDPAGGDVEGVELAADDCAAVAGADLVLSVNWASEAVGAARSASHVLREGQLYADLNTGAPGMKREVAEVIAGTGAAFADVALMAPVPGRGVRTPALASGPGAPLFARVMVGFGMPVTLLEAEPGEAAARKLARSVYVKGMAAAIGEALEAGERLGCADWLAGDIGRTLDEADAAFAERLLSSSRLHARRRMDEMAAAAAMLDELGVEPRMATATEAWLRTLVASEVGG
jgi:3-hydroxyisobutyrate dehydrogenase-like beta-hydroxyacid dehydrogenase